MCADPSVGKGGGETRAVIVEGDNSTIHVAATRVLLSAEVFLAPLYHRLTLSNRLTGLPLIDVAQPAQDISRTSNVLGRF